MNIHWPQTPEKRHLAPWYVVGWRLIWYVPIVASGLLLLLFSCISHGPHRAREFIDDIFR